MSGAPLSVRSREVLRKFRPLTRKKIISVGGIMSTDEAQARWDLGADLIQIYSGWVYGGPGFANALVKAGKKNSPKREFEAVSKR